MELHTTFESFTQNNIDTDRINKDYQNDVENIPPGFRDDYGDEDNQKPSLPEYIEEFRQDILKTALYGQIAGAFVNNLIHRYGDDITSQQWSAVFLYLEDYALNQPTKIKIAEAFKVIESQFAADKLRTNV
jgi:hypothetical protein